MTLPFPVPSAAPVSKTRPTPETLLHGLNEAQRTAVSHEGGPLLVVAGAGSGKTRVLTRRIAWVIAAQNAHPGSILAITFTNKAAAEMRERVAELVGPRAKLMWVSTFHSACVRILRKEVSKFGYTSSFSIYDSADSKRLMTLVCREMELDPKRYNPRAILNWVSNAKNELLDHEAAAGRAGNDTEKVYAEAYGIYQRRLVAANAMDFDDLIMNTVFLFRAFPEIREVYRRRFRNTPSSVSSATSPTRTCWSSATPISRSMPSVAPTSATSSSSRSISPMPRRSCSSRTTARPRRSSRPPTP